MIIRKQFLKTAGISLIILSVMFGCGCFKRNLSTVSNDAGPVKINDDTGSKGNKGQVLAQAVVYKTSKDYSAFVPVILSADKKEIVSYPAPTDVYYRGKLAYPVALKNGYCLDIRGINEYAAFTDFTYQEYAALKTAPTKEELMKRIVSIPNPPLYRLKKNGLGVTSLSKSVLSLFYLVLWEQFFPVYWSLQGRYFFECGS